MTDTPARDAPTLRSRLFLLVLAVALPLMLLAAAAMLDGYRGERRRAEERLHEQARALALVIDRELGRAQAVLETLATSQSLHDATLAAFDDELRAASVVLRDMPMALIGPDNQQVLSTAWPRGGTRAGMIGPQALQDVFRTGQPVISDLIVGRNTQRWIIAIGVPVTAAAAGPATTAQGKVAYCLAVGVPADSLSAALAEQDLPPGWVAAVIDRTGHVVARSVAGAKYTGTVVIPQLLPLLEHEDQGVVRAPRIDGTLATAVFERAPVSRFVVVLSVPEEVFLQPLRRALWRTLVPAAAVSLFGLAAALLMARRLAASISGLAEDRATPARLREVQRVAAKLARIAAERDAAEAGLRTLAGRLEQEVAQRTEALAEREARLRGIFDSQFAHISLVDLQGRRLDANRAVLAFHNARLDDLVGVPVWDTPWIRGRPAAAAQVRDAVTRAAGGENVRFELSLTGSDGREGLLDLSFQPVRDSVTGSVRMIIVEGHDITELRALEARLAQASRLEALGQLAGGVAHDFNNVLQSIAGGVSLIARRAEDPAAVRQLAALMSDAINRGASVTRRLLGFARQDALRAVPVDAASLLANMQEVLSHTLGGSIGVEVAVPAGLPPLLADRSQLETVLVNLATNARDAMPSGGTLRFAAAEAVVTAAEAATTVPVLAQGRYISLSARDTGSGMDAATLARAVEPFFTTKPTGKGTGLGLAMARGFAEQSGGALAIDSAPARGTTVTLWLPQAESPDPARNGAADPALDGAADAAQQPAAPAGDAAALAPPPPAMPPAPARDAAARTRLLVADDSDLVRAPLCAMLASYGFSVVEAADGQAALALLDDAARRGEAMALLITDLSMPGMNGLDLIRAAQARQPGLPAILLTGYPGEAAAIGEASLPAFTLLRKPVPPGQLADRVAAILATTAPTVAATLAADLVSLSVPAS